MVDTKNSTSVSAPTKLSQSDLDDISREMLSVIADINGDVSGAVNIRSNGCLACRNNTEHVTISTKTDNPGIDIHVDANSKNERVFIPVVVTEDGLVDKVYNDFFIGENAEVTIVAGCGIHNSGSHKAEHDGIHRFFCGRGSHVKYTERHYGEGEGTGDRVLNPQTEVYLEEGAVIEMEMTQIGGVSSAIRKTTGELKKDSRVVITEKLFTEGEQKVTSDVDFNMIEDGATVRIISRSVGRGNSVQLFRPMVTGMAACRGHVQCDSIIMDNAHITSVPAIDAQSTGAELVHEAAIGKIAGDAIIKLMTLGLTEEEAEEQILQDFLS